jgi:L-ascorbate metabolism protein UlaG (beta-lactamase superfamily)
MNVRLIRHATLLADIAGRRLLIDPQLDPAEARDAIAGTPEPRRNPLVDLPVPAEEIVRGLDALLVTHLHADHLDDTAVGLLRGLDDLPVLCQPEDAESLRERGFTDVRPVEDRADLPGGIEVHRTGGRHGHGDLADTLGPVSGFVLRAEGEPSLYVAGDTVWCDQVAEAITGHRPDVTVVNAGGARFLEGDPITMTPDDVRATAGAAAPGRVIAVHMEAINHCLQTRADLHQRLRQEGLADRVAVPEDGAVVPLRTRRGG